MHRTKAYAVVAASIASLLAPTLASTAAAAPTAVSSSTATQQTETSVLGSILTPGQQITAGSSIQSPNGRYRLAFEGGASLFVSKAPNRLTAERYHRNALLDAQGDRLAMQTDGNLVPDKNNRAQYSSRTDGRSVAGLVMQGGGNLMQYVNGRAVFVRDDVYSAEMRPDGNFVGVQLALEQANLFPPAFATRTAGNPGSRLVVQGDGNLVVFTPSNKAVYSRT